MLNRKKLCGMLLLCALGCTLFSSCKKDVSFEDTEVQTTDDAITDADTSSGRLKLASTYVRKNLLFDHNTESLDASLFDYSKPAKHWHAKYAYNNRSVNISSAAARAGKYCIRYELNKSDGMVASGKRAETYRNPRGETSPRAERWYGASFYLAGDYVYDSSPEIVTQWHSIEYHGTPELAVWTVSGQWRVVQFGTIGFNLGNYEKNKWTDLVFHVKWTTGTDGVIEVWKNGVKVVTKPGQTMRSGETIPPFFRTGLYKWHWNTGSKTYSSTNKRVLYVDEVRVGNNYATYADVKPGS